MQETWVQSLGWEDPMEREIETHSSIFAWEIPGQRSLAGYIVHGVAKVGNDLVTDQRWPIGEKTLFKGWTYVYIYVTDCLCCTPENNTTS